MHRQHALPLCLWGPIVLFSWLSPIFPLALRVLPGAGHLCPVSWVGPLPSTPCDPFCWFLLGRTVA